MEFAALQLGFAINHFSQSYLENHIDAKHGRIFNAKNLQIKIHSHVRGVADLSFSRHRLRLSGGGEVQIRIL